MCKRFTHSASMLRHGSTIGVRPIAPMGGKVSVNGQRLTGRRDLASGDRIEVSGLKLEFKLS